MNQSRGGTCLAIVGTLIAFAALIVAILNYLAPFSPIGPSPLAPDNTDLTVVAYPISTAPVSVNVPVPSVELPATPLIEPSPATAEPTLAPAIVSDTATLPQAGDIRMVMRDGVVVEQVFVPAGTFMMGSEDDNESERPVHEVTLDAFWLDRTEVTNVQYAACVVNGVCSPPSESSSSTRGSYYFDSNYTEYPVINISWYDALAYCEWANGRLPTEAEWEYAARGPDSLTYPWGNEQPSCALLNYNNVCAHDTVRVGSYPNGASWVDALDMAGNVAEWVHDWWDIDYYQFSSAENPAGPASGEQRALRGGGWLNIWFFNEERSSFRIAEPPDSRDTFIGFRCAQD